MVITYNIYNEYTIKLLFLRFLLNVNLLSNIKIINFDFIHIILSFNKLFKNNISILQKRMNNYYNNKFINKGNIQIFLLVFKFFKDTRKLCNY